MSNSSGQSDPSAAMGAAISEEQLKKAEKFIEQEEGAVSHHRGWFETVLAVALVAMSLFHLYATVSTVPLFVLRPAHVGMTMALVFLIFPAAKRFRNRLMWFDVLLVLLSITTIAYLLLGGDDFLDRNNDPNKTDIVLGVVFVLLLLEVTRRTSGWIMVFVLLVFIAYFFIGPYLPSKWSHTGKDIAYFTGFMYMTQEGIFGGTVGVSASLIILFTIYGAFLQYSGAGKFFLDFSFAALGSRPSGVGRTVVLSSFLLGGPSGSGVATTVTIGSVAYPMMKRAGYDAAAAGGLLAAGGLGAIISPPVLGAAAFLIAEFLKISFIDVLWMAVIPTCLYYFSLLLMVEIDARRYNLRLHDAEASADEGRRQRLWKMMCRYGYHFLSLVSIIVFMVFGYTPEHSVLWATVVTAATVFLGYPFIESLKHIWRALKEGSHQMLNVAATCAGAGIIVGVVAKTGLGHNISNIIVSYAGGSLFLTALFTAIAVWVVGLAVPVTASYIICASITAPALITLGVPDFAAHMFIFYYAVLSEVSPPTALSPFAAAAMTGANPYKTTLQSWKYTMPAFVVPFMFVLTPEGIGLLLKTPPGGDWLQVVWIALSACAGIGIIAAGMQGWLTRRCGWPERLLLIAGGLGLVYPHVYADVIGTALVGLALVLYVLGGRALTALVVKK